MSTEQRVTKLAYKLHYDFFQHAFSFLAGCRGRRSGCAGGGGLLQFQFQFKHQREHWQLRVRESRRR